MTLLHVERGPLAVTIDPEHGARLVSFRAHGHELLSTVSVPGVPDSIGRGSYPMVPWAGRVGGGVLHHDGRATHLPVEDDGHALHGLGRDAAWQRTGELELRTRLGAPWPVDGEAVLRYALDDDVLRCSLTWDGDGPGASLGFHPWFRRRLDDGTEARLDVGLVQQLERGPDHLPTGDLVAVTDPPWDDCFVVDRPPVVEWSGRVRLHLDADTPWWVLFTEPDHAVCAEPQTAPPDAWNHSAFRGDLTRRSLTFTLRAESLA